MTEATRDAGDGHGRGRHRASPDRKGVSVPDSTIDFGALTAKDRSDLEAALNAGVDWIALSFVQRPEDLAEVQEDRARPRRA